MRKGPDRTGEKMYQIGRIVSQENGPNESSEKASDQTNSAVQDKPAKNSREDIKAPDPEKTLKYQRLLENLIAENPEITRRSLQRKVKHAYNYMRDNDFSWFEATIPKRRPGGIAIDWKALDLEVASKLPELARQKKQQEGKPHNELRVIRCYWKRA